MMTIRTPRNIPPRWIFLTVASSSGGGGPGGVPGGGGVEVISIRWCRALRWTVSAYVIAMRYRMMPATSHGWLCGLILQGDQISRTPVIPWKIASG